MELGALVQDAAVAPHSTDSEFTSIVLVDDAAAGGGFILGTGDQCGRDTPFDNLHAVVETARTYGRYG